MSKRSNKGKAYFYAKGQRDRLNGANTGARSRRNMRFKLPLWARIAWDNGYYGY